jgi:hypothetical protein
MYNFFNEGLTMTTQTSISIELLCLINWILENDKASLEAMVKRALEKDFSKALQDLNVSEPDDAMYAVLFDLIEFLENCLFDHLSEVKMDEKIQGRIIPMLQKLEGRNIDIRTLWLSMQQTKTQIHAQALEDNALEPKVQDAQEILVTQLLKNWKPDNSETVN